MILTCKVKFHGNSIDLMKVEDDEDGMVRYVTHKIYPTYSQHVFISIFFTILLLLVVANF